MTPNIKGRYVLYLRGKFPSSKPISREKMKHDNLWSKEEVMLLSGRYFQI